MNMKTILKESTTLGCHELFLSKKIHQEWKGKPSPIGKTSRLPTNGWVVPINNNGGVPFKSDGGGLPRGGGSGPLGGGSNKPLGDQNLKPYAIGPTRPWIGPT